MSAGFHGKSIEEIVDLRFKEWEIRKAREREEREALQKAASENKADVTAPKPAQIAAAHEFHLPPAVKNVISKVKQHLHW